MTFLRAICINGHLLIVKTPPNQNGDIPLQSESDVTYLSQQTNTIIKNYSETSHREENLNTDLESEHIPTTQKLNQNPATISNEPQQTNCFTDFIHEDISPLTYPLYKLKDQFPTHHP
jgi:hypothetical protein